MKGRLLGVALLAVACTLAPGATAPAVGQAVRLAGSPRNDNERALAAFLERGGYVVWARDTVLARGDVVSSHVLVLEASVRIAGTIEGDVFVVDGDLFLRTRGRVAGDIVVLGGGFYDSELAEIGGTITYRPNELIRVRPTEGDFEIFSVMAAREPFTLDGTWGIHIPTYQRVDALTLGWGGMARFDDVVGRPDLEFSGGYATGPQEFRGVARNSWYPSRRVRIGVSGGRETRTNDGWIRPTWFNSLSTLVSEDDSRNYYRADRINLELEVRSPEPPIWEDASEWSLTFGAGWEEARSIEARDIFAVFDDDADVVNLAGGMAPVEAPGSPNPNPSVDEGDLFSLTAGLEWSRRGKEGRAAFGLSLEAAHDDDLTGDLSFLMAEARISARRVLPWGHAADGFAILRAEVAGTLPGQRYSTIGGIGTIPTMPLRSMRGPEVFYAETTYAVPLLGMATLGGLDAFVRGSGGAAWGAGVPFHLEESVMGGLAVRVWDFQMEWGFAAGSGPSDGVDTTTFFDVRIRRSARPTQMPRAGHGF